MTMNKTTLVAIAVTLLGSCVPAQAFDMPASDAARQLGKADAHYDHRFIDAMIPHHEKAVAMAKDAAKKAKRPEVRQMAQNIIRAQEREIAQLKAWRKKWFGETR